MSDKIKFHGYVDVFREKLEKLCKQIKKARKHGEIKKAYAKQLIKEAKDLRELLKKVEKQSKE